MKKIVTLLLTLCLLSTLCLFAVSCGDDEDVPDDMQNVAAENAGYKFYVPAGWLSQANSGVSGARYSNGSEAVGGDKSNVTMTKYVPNYAEEGKPENYWKMLEDSYHKQFSDFEMDESCVQVAEDGTKTTVGLDTKLGGRNAKKYVYTMTFGGVDYKQMQVLCQGSNGDVYIFTYTARPDYYSAHLEEVDAMLKEFRFG